MPNQKNLSDHINNILNELRIIQKNPNFPGPEHGIPGMIDAGERGSLLTNGDIERSIISLADIMIRNDPDAARQFTIAEWRALVRRSLGIPLAAIDLDDPDAVKIIRKRLRESMAQARETHGDREYAVGCSLFWNDDIQPIEIGPVRIEAREQWLTRMAEEKNIDGTTARRIRKNWSGHKLSKRRNALDRYRETDILQVLGKCAFVCSVKTVGLPPETGKSKALMAARMALASVSLVWQRPSAVLDGFRLEIDQNLKQRRILTFEPGKIILAGSKLSHLPHGARLNRGEWEREARRFAQSFAAAGEVLAFVIHPTGNVARPTLCSMLMQALLWFHEACREEIDAMAVVKFTSSLDALAGGKGEPAIRQVLSARLGWKDGDPIGDFTVSQAISRIYGEGRSRTVHGTNNKLSTDFSEMRNTAEIISRFALVSCLFWFASNPDIDDPEKIREN